MKINQLQSVLEKSLEGGFKRPIFVWGPPGIGKSQSIKQISEKLGVGFIDFRLIYYDTVDLRGIPFPVMFNEHGEIRNVNSMRDFIPVSSTRTVWFMPSIFPSSGKGILFLDELNIAEPDVQKVALQLALDRRIDEYVLPDGWIVVAAGNRSGDRAFVYDLSSPLANRFIHIELEIDASGWLSWAKENGIHQYVIAYIKKQGHHLFQFDGSQHTTAFPTPRTWEYVSDVLYHFDGTIRDEMVLGAIGNGVGIEFLTFIKIFENFPDIDEILSDPEHAPVPQEPDIKHALVNSLCGVITNDKLSNVKKIRRYIERFGEEYEISFIRLIAETKPEILETSEIALWAVKFAKLLNM